MAEEKEKKEKKEAKAKPAGEGGGKAAGGKAAKSGKREKSGKGGFTIAEPGSLKVSPKQTPSLRVLYAEKIVPALQKEFNFDNQMQVPRLKKVVLNCCVKDSVGNPKILDGVVSDMSIIAGQKAVITRAKKAIAGFKLRAGLAIGARVTLRRARMYEFLDRLINTALPRVRDFKGVNPKSFDGRGNYSMGIREHIIFPEIDYDKVETVFGFTITVETTAKKNEEARSLLTHLGMPFKK